MINFDKNIILGGIFDTNSVKKRILDLNQEILKIDFWKDGKKSKKITKEKNFLENIVNFYDQSLVEISNLKDLNKLAIEEKNQEILNDCSNKILNILKEIKNFEIKCFLSGENDKLDIYIEIHAGAGGTESQDWADMLRRMYLKWFDKKRFGYELISEHKGEEAGIKSCTLKVTGENLYGLMKKESGVHRLVRISPFDSGARRHTSFASVWIYPSVDDEIDIVIDEKDLRIDTYRSSGAGGQHVNTTDSAEYEIQKREEKNQNQIDSKTDIGWGHQIRSYVLQPYRLVKDLRFKTEDTNPDEVLNGNIDKFIESGIFGKMI